MKMSNEHYPYLCGGILLNLLIEAKKPAISSREKLNGKKNSFKDSDILNGLIKLVTGEEIAFNGDTLKKITTQYKKCEINGNSYITFTDSSTVNAFYNRYTNNYNELLEETSDFINTYISKSKLEWIIKSLIEIIQGDNIINDDSKFYIDTSIPIKKNEFHKIKDLTVEVFLLSIIMFILNYKKNNKKGRDYFEFICYQDTPRGSWKLNEYLGKSNRYINIKRYKNVIFNDSNKDKNIHKYRVSNASKSNNLMPESNNSNYLLNNISKREFYNLIVGGIEHATFSDFNNKIIGVFYLKLDRVLNLWSDEVAKPLKNLDIKARKILMSFPTIFAVDQGPSGHKDGDLSYYGYIRNLQVFSDYVKIMFEVISSFDQIELYNNNLLLGIEDFELYNTHWAVKHINTNNILDCINSNSNIL